MPVADAVDLVSDRGRRIDKRDYAESGPIPVVDQGEAFIGGFTNDISAVIGRVPIVVFGDHTRRVKFVDFPFAVGAQGVKLLTPRSGWDARFLAYLLAVCPLPPKGYSRHWSDLRKRPIPQPPLDEQTAIVTELDTHLTRIASAASQLQQIRSRLTAFRSSLFEALTHPRLRTVNHHSPQLPVGWEWRSLAELARPGDASFVDGPFGSNLKTSDYIERGPLVIRLQNVGDAEFIEAPAHISQSHYERLSRHWVEGGDVIIAALGDSPPRACVVPSTLGPAIVKADCYRLRTDPEIADPRFLVYSLNSAATKKRAAAMVHGVGRRRLTLTSARDLKITLPAIDEQRRIVERIEAADSVRASIVHALIDAERRALFLSTQIFSHVTRSRGPH